VLSHLHKTFIQRSIGCFDKHCDSSTVHMISVRSVLLGSFFTGRSRLGYRSVVRL
jgi:hypothetical protein